MCGIVGYVGKAKAAPIILDGLKRLEYRGYDSAGVAILKDGAFKVAKQVGRVAGLQKTLAQSPLEGTRGIGHTRWATHGGVTDANAHPHVFEGYWEDIGTVKAFFDTNLAITDELPPFDFFDEDAPIYTHNRALPPSKINKCTIHNAVIGDGCIIEDSQLTRCVISSRSYIRSGTVLSNVVMMGSDSYETDAEFDANRSNSVPNYGVGHNCRISGAIIDKNTRIGDNVELSAEGKEDGNYDHGVVIRDGVLVVPKGISVPAGYKL